MSMPKEKKVVWMNPVSIGECEALIGDIMGEYPLVYDTSVFEDDGTCSVPARTVYKATGSTYPFKVWLEKVLCKKSLERGVDYKTVDLDPSTDENAIEISKGRGTLFFFRPSVAHELARSNDAYLDALCMFHRLETCLDRFRLEEGRIELKRLREKHADELREVVQSLNQHLNALTSQEPQGEQA